MTKKFLSATAAAAILFVGCTAQEAQPIAEIEEEPVPVAQEVRIAAQNDEVAFYAVPLDEEYQSYIMALGEEKDIDPEVIFALMFVESSYESDAVGDSGNSYGLMQVQPRWHEERMERLGVMDLLDPYENAAVGVDYLSELYAQYEDIEMALVAYNAGPTGAKKFWFSKGVYSSEYSRKVMEETENIEKLPLDGQR